MSKFIRVIPYARNSRTHDDSQVRQLAGSIKEFGFTNDVLIKADGGIIAGHGRVIAAELLGMDEVPCKVIGDDWTSAKTRAYILADNQLALNSGWNEELLQIELSELDMAGFDLDLLGFDADELAGLLGGVDDPGIDDEPESSSKEIDTEFDLEHKCPKCGFEYD